MTMVTTITAQAGNCKPKAMIREIPVEARMRFIGHSLPAGPSCWVKLAAGRI